MPQFRTRAASNANRFLGEPTTANKRSGVKKSLRRHGQKAERREAKRIVERRLDELMEERFEQRADDERAAREFADELMEREREQFESEMKDQHGPHWQLYLFADKFLGVPGA